MTYERFGEEWVEKECSSEDGQDATNEQDSSDGKDTTEDQSDSDDWLAVDETCYQNKCEMNGASVCQINRCVNADNEMTFCELFADFGWI